MLRLGDWEGHGKTFVLWVLMGSSVDFKVFLGSFSICRSHPLFNFSVFTDGIKLVSKMCWNIFESILPGPPAAIQPQSTIDPPPCPTVGLRFVTSTQTYLRSVRPKCLTWSVHRTSVQNASGLFISSFANFKHWILWWGRRKGFHLRTLPWRPYLYLFTVEPCTTAPVFLEGWSDVRDGQSDVGLDWALSWSSRSYFNFHCSCWCHFLVLLPTEDIAIWKGFAIFL